MGKEIEGQGSFDLLKDRVELKSEFYVLKPQFSGFSFFLGRKKIKERFDVFISLFDNGASSVLDVINDFDPEIHFLAVEDGGSFSAAYGPKEVEEYLRAVCVKKNNPGLFWDYMRCRAESKESAWWQDCIKEADISLIKACAQGQEGKTLLQENIALNKELKIMFGPTYLINNTEIFSSRGAPSKEELLVCVHRINFHDLSALTPDMLDRGLQQHSDSLSAMSLCNIETSHRPDFLVVHRLEGA